MIHQEAKVISLNGKFALVETEENTACPSCQAKNICEQGEKRGVRVVEAINEANANLGQKVIITIDSKSLVKGSSIVFLIPTVLLLIGIFSGDYFGRMFFGEEKAELTSFLSGVLAFIISYFIIKRVSKNLDKDDSYYPVIKEIL